MIRIVLFLLLSSLMGSCFAQTSLPGCRDADTSQWTNCFGSIEAKNGNKYVGGLRNGIPHGSGVLNFANGNRHVGWFKDGQRDGRATVNFANGNKFIGEYKEDRRNGQGTLFGPDGRIIYQGMWADDKFLNSVTTQEANVPSNTLVSAGSNVQSNLPACQGTDFSKWDNCFGSGNGPIGIKWAGEYKNGERNGQGMETYANGDRYVGEYKNGLHNGQGTYTYDNGKVSQGIFSNGRFVSSYPINQANTPNGQQTPSSISEIEKLRLETEEAKKQLVQVEEQKRLQIQQAELRERELQEQLKIAQQRPNSPQSGRNSGIGKRIALVVGNSNYKVRPLKNSGNDADDVSRSLKATGFDVIDLRDATLPQMRTAVRQFGDRLISNDVGLVYYSGHGVEVKGRNYFIPVNADIQREDEIADQGLDVSLILEKMSTAGKGVNILIVDACRDDPFGRSFRSSSRGLAQMDAPRGTIIAYATSPGKVASDGDPRERNSPYTKHLVKAMQSPNKPIEQVFKEVRRAVQDETKNQQTPWENTSLSGDFFFRVQK